MYIYIYTIIILVLVIAISLITICVYIYIYIHTYIHTYTYVTVVVCVYDFNRRLLRARIGHLLLNKLFVNMLSLVGCWFILVHVYVVVLVSWCALCVVMFIVVLLVCLWCAAGRTPVRAPNLPTKIIPEHIKHLELHHKHKIRTNKTNTTTKTSTNYKTNNLNK